MIRNYDSLSSRSRMGLKRKWQKSILLLLFFMFCSVMGVQAQISVTVGNPTNTTPNLAATYPSLSTALTDLNAVTAMSGPVTLTLTGSETAPATGFTIGSATLNPVLNATNTVSLLASGTVTINAGVGTATPGSAAPDGMLKLVGADFITLDGITFTDGNATNPSTMEYGVGLFKLSATDGANNNTVQNCIFNMQRINNATGTAPMVEGAVGILMINSTATAATTNLTVTAASGSNSNNKFYTNAINGGNYGMALIGFAAATPFTLADTNNDVGGTALGTGNTILNFGGGAATNPAAGIRTLAQYGLNVSFNTINNNNGSGVSHATILRGIFINTATSASANINNNNVTVRNLATTSIMEGISNAAGSTAASNTININNNTITSGLNASATTSVFNGIINSSTAAIVNINGNIMTGFALSGTGTHVLIEGGSPVTLNTNNNSITNITRNGASGSWRIIKATTPTTAWNCNNNTIDGISWTLATSTGSADGIYDLSSGATTNIGSNTVRNLSTPLTGTLTGININTVQGTHSCTNNIINTFTTTAGGVGGGTFRGIVYSVGNATISGNIINSLNSTGTTGGTGGAITGIQQGGGTNNTMFNNKVYDLSSTSTGATIIGLNLSGGTTNTAYNNLVGDLRAPAANLANAIRGIDVASTNGNVYFNTVNLSAAASSGATFGTSAINASSVTNLILRNNIFVNTSGVKGTGLSVAYRRSSTTLTSYGATSNNNLFTASTIYTDGTNTDTGFAAYQTRVSTRDNLSINVTPNFLSTTGSNANFLHIDTAIATQIESGAAAIAGITADYDADLRNVSTPDIGADEFAGTTPAPAVTLISVTPSTNQCTATARAISVNVTTASGTITGAVLNYAFNGVAQTPIAMTNTSGTVWDASTLVATPVNAVVTWNVVATNSLPLSTTFIGASFQDEPFFGTTSSALSSATTLCLGGTTDLTGIVGTAGGTRSLGAGASTSSSAGASMFSGAWGGHKTQYIIRASELTAAGILPGNITSLAFEATNAFNGYQGFAVNIGHTAATVAAFPMITTGLTQVYTGTGLLGAYATTVGVNTLPFSSAFNWDGVSNIVVSFCWSKDPIAASTTGTTVRVDTTAFTCTASGQSDNTLPAAFCPKSATVDFGTTTTGTSRPKFTFTGVVSTPMATFSWHDGTSVVGTTNPLTVTPPSGTTTYTVTMGTATGCTTTASVTVTPLALPTAPTSTDVARCGTGLSASSVTSTTGAPTPTFRWYAALTGGAALQSSTSATYTTPVSTTTTLYVTEFNGSCESSPRTAVVLTVNPPPTISVAVTSGLQVNCGAGPFTVELSATSIADPTMTYVWSTASTTATINSNVGGLLNATVTESTDFVVTGTPTDPSCDPVVVTFPVSVYALPNANVTTSASGVCSGTSATINSGLSSDAFSAVCITPQSVLSTPPVSAVTLINGASGVLVTAGANSTTNIDDNFWTVPIGFSFNYLGTAYTNVFVSTNGILSFIAGTTSFSFPSGFPSVSSPAAAIAVCGRDLHFTAASTGALRYWVEGTSPNRRFIVQYDDVNTYDTRLETIPANIGKNSAEAVFYETLGNVDVRVINANNGIVTAAGNSTNKLIGLQNTAQTVGAVAPRCSPATLNYWNAVTTEILAPQAWRFSPPADYNITWSTVGAGNVLTTVSSGLNLFTLSVSPTSTTVYDLRYTNTTTGCSNVVDSDRVTMDIITDTAPSTTAVASAGSICLGGSVNLSLTGNLNNLGTTTGLTYQWQVDTGAGFGNVSSATSDTLTVSPTVGSTYQCLVTACTGTAVASTSVVVTVAPPITLSASSASICTGFTSNVTLTSPVGNYDTYVWTPATGVTGDEFVGWTFAPTTTTAYTLTATQLTGLLCSTTATYTVTVNSTPVTASVSATTVCLENNAVTLTATSTTAGSGNTGGAGTGSIGGDEGNPYRSGNGAGNQLRTQILVTAGELAAAGVPAGNITSLAFTTTAASTGTMLNFSIAMGHTSATALTTTFETTTTTPVFTQASFTPASSGLNVHTFSSPFVWNGSSNVLINVCQTNDVLGTATVVTETLGFNATTHRSGSATGCTDTTGSSSLTSRPIMAFGFDNIAPTTYAWTSSPSGFTASTAIASANPAVTTTYYVVATNTATGCSSDPASVTVTVNTDPVDNITGGAAAMCIGSGTIDFDTTTVGVTWSSSDNAVATVDANGVVTALTAGTTTINAFINNLTTGCITYAANPQTVTVYVPLAITVQPAPQSVLDPSVATFSVTATGSILASPNGYQWQVSSDNIAFADVSNDATYSGVTTSTLTINATGALSGLFYRCEVNGNSPCATPLNSDGALLTVSTLAFCSFPEPITVPVSVVACTTGTGEAEFEVCFDGATPDEVVWEYYDLTSWVVLDGTETTLGAVTYTTSFTPALFPATTSFASLTLNNLALINNGWKIRVNGVVGATVITSPEATITVNQPATISVQPADQTVCYSGGTSSFSVTATGGTGYQWQYSTSASGPWSDVANSTPAGATYTGATTASMSVATTAATPAAGTYFYQVVVSSPTSCDAATSSAAQLNITTPIITATGGGTVCNPGGTPLTLTGGGAGLGGTYSWSPATGLSGTSGDTVTANPTVTTIYTVTGTTAAGCSNTATVTVTVADAVTATATATPATVCSGADSQLNAVVGGAGNTVDKYAFAASSAPFTTLSGGTNSTASGDDGTENGIAIGFPFAYNGVTATTFSISTNGFIKIGANVQASGWTNGLGTNTNIVGAMWDDDNRDTGSISYLTTGTAPNRVLTVEWNSITIGGGGSTGLANSSFQIQLFETTNEIKMNYDGLDDSNGITASIGISGAVGKFLSVTPAPVATASAVTANNAITSVADIPGGTVYTFSPPTYTYSWSPATFLSSTSIANPVATAVTADTTYTVTVTSSSGCTATATTTVTVASGIAITTQPAAASFCQGTTATLSVVATGAGLTYQWRKGGVDIGGQTAATLSIPAATPADSGSYDVVINDTCGSPAVTSDAVTLTINPTPTVTSPGNQTACSGTATAAITLTGTPSGVTYNVTGGAAIGLANQTGVTAIPSFTPITGTATISVTPVANACTGTAITFTYTVNETPSAVTVTPSSSTIGCSDGPVLLTGAGGIVAPSAYCTPTVTQVGETGDNITNFTFAGINNTTGDGPGDYNAYLSPSAVVTAGTATPFSITPDPGFGQQFRVWVDMNQNGVFEATESVFNTTASSTSTVSGNITIPTTAYNGTTRLRIQDRFSSATAATEACGFSGFGEYEDYTVTISGATPAPAGTFVWTSTGGGLFTDAAGTIAYTGTPAATVYADPAATATITATSTVGGCSSSGNATVTVDICDSIVNLTLFIEGYLDGTNMRSVNNNQGGAMASTDVEILTVELHDATTLAALHTTTAMLHTDGTLQAVFSSAPSGSFFISVRGTNFIRTWGATAQTVGTTALDYDFSSAASQAAGDNMKDVGGIFVFYSGDLDADGFIDVPDYTTWETDYNNGVNSVVAPTDIDGDGFVDVPDYTIWEANYNAGVFEIQPTP